jgi:hypothetical protein
MTNRRFNLMNETVQYLLFIKNWSNFNKSNTKKYDDLYDYDFNSSDFEEDKKVSKKGKEKAIILSSKDKEDISDEEASEEVDYEALD